MKKTLLILLSIMLSLTAIGFALDIPADGGKALFEEKCSICHTPLNATSMTNTKEAWTEYVMTMKDYGCPIDNTQAEIIIHYLTTFYGE